jgi:Tfp pilus assembly protein PilN
MRDINLIPPDVFRARRAAARVRLWIGVNLGAAGLTALAVALAFWNVGSLRAAAWELDARMAQLKDLTGELERLRIERALLDTEEQTLGILVNRTPDCDLLRDLSEAAVDRAWLRQIEISRPLSFERKDSRAGLLKLEGHAGSYRHLADLMRNLESLDWIGAVELRKSQQAEADGLNAVGFELECEMVAGDGNSRSPDPVEGR